MSARQSVVEALECISPDCSQSTWWRVARAIYDILGEDGFDLFDDWSSRSAAKYPGTDGCKRQWSFSKTYTKITGSTSFYIAKHGEMN